MNDFSTLNIHELTVSTATEVLALYFEIMTLVCLSTKLAQVLFIYSPFEGLLCLSYLHGTVTRLTVSLDMLSRDPCFHLEVVRFYSESCVSCLRSSVNPRNNATSPWATFQIQTITLMLAISKTRVSVLWIVLFGRKQTFLSGFLCHWS